MLIKQTKFNDNVAGSSFASIVIKTNVKTLLKVFGKPTIIGSGDDKTQLEWQYVDDNDNNKIVTIYDYKSEVPINKVKEWHIGAKGIEKEIIFNSLKSKGIDEVDIEKV